MIVLLEDFSPALVTEKLEHLFFLFLFLFYWGCKNCESPSPPPPPPAFLPSSFHTHHTHSLSSFLSLCRVHPHIKLLPLLLLPVLRPLWNRKLGDACRRQQSIRLNPAGDSAKRRDHFL